MKKIAEMNELELLEQIRLYADSAWRSNSKKGRLQTVNRVKTMCARYEELVK
jgi:hypothetical protein